LAVQNYIRVAINQQGSLAGVSRCAINDNAVAISKGGRRFDGIVIGRIICIVRVRLQLKAMRAHRQKHCQSGGDWQCKNSFQNAGFDSHA
jgi:hypothetical protein